MQNSEEYTCSCRPIGLHTNACLTKYEHIVLERLYSLKKSLQDSKQSRLGSSEVYEAHKTYHYAVTLTGHSCYTNILNSIRNSSMFSITHLCYGEEQNENDVINQLKHLHILIRSIKFIDSKEIYVKNKKKRVDVKLLRNKTSLMKWHRYIHKETTFGTCCVDTSGSEIIILP